MNRNVQKDTPPKKKHDEPIHHKSGTDQDYIHQTEQIEE